MIETVVMCCKACGHQVIYSGEPIYYPQGQGTFVPVPDEAIDKILAHFYEYGVKHVFLPEE